MPPLGTREPSGQSGRSPNALSYDQLGSCADGIEENMEFARKKAWDPTRFFSKNGLLFRHVKNIFRPPNRNDEEKI